MSETRQPLLGLYPEEIAGMLDLKGFQGRQIFQWIHGRGCFDFDAMSNLAKPLRARLAAECDAGAMDIAGSQVADDGGAVKVLFALSDGERVESVLLRDDGRVTLCVSSQAGCPLKCAFCATGAGGFRRNLTAAEIVGQVLGMLSSCEIPRDVTPNIVYMGMGEPFLNYDNVAKSIRLLMHPDGLGVGARRITVSTVGVAGGIERFAVEQWQVRLSVSLHAANDELRSSLVPQNRVFDLARLRGAVREYGMRTGRQVTFEWTLIDGVNDRPSDARELLAFAKGLNAFANLIPWNAVPGLPYSPSSRERCLGFVQALEKGGLKATLRRENGAGISAACGQLRASTPE